MTDPKIENNAPLVLVVGGGGGIGAMVAKRFSIEGNTVVAADISATEFTDSAIIHKSCDVRKGQDIDALFEWMATSTGFPDVLVYCAGKGIHEQLIEGDPEKWHDVLNVNLMGALRSVRAFVPAMIGKGEGDVVLVSSVSADKPYRFGGVYGASKAALNYVAETLRLEVMPTIRVTVVEPGITNSSFFDNEIPGNRSAEDFGIVPAQPADIAEDIYYAVSRRRGITINKITSRPSGQEF